ncbi:DUF3617 domain-containing protein [Brevundimonas sp.]
MRTMIPISAALALGLAACGQGGETKTDAVTEGAAPTAAAVLEGPQPGLWRVTTAMTGVPGGATVPAVEHCVTEAQFEAPAQGSMPGADCTTEAFRREGDAVVGGTVCQMQGMKTESTIRVTGDFSSRYVMEVRTRMDPAPMPEMAETVMTMTGERLGDCPAT